MPPCRSRIATDDSRSRCIVASALITVWLSRTDTTGSTPRPSDRTGRSMRALTEEARDHRYRTATLCDSTPRSSPVDESTTLSR